MPAVRAELHVAVKKEQPEFLSGNPLLPQVGRREKERACKKTKGKADSCSFRLGIPIGLKEGRKLTQTQRRESCSLALVPTAQLYLSFL